MKIYNQDKTQVLNEDEIDFEKGYTKPDKIFVAHHEAMEAVEEVSHYETIAEYSNGGKEVKKIIDRPKTAAKDAYDEYENILVYMPYSEDELKARADKKRYAILKEELVKIKEDIEQEVFGLVRDDYAVKKARAAEIINELRVLEGKEPREIITEVRADEVRVN